MMSIPKTKQNAKLARLQKYVKGCIAIGALFWVMGFAVVIAANETHYSVIGCSLIFVGFSICIRLFSGFNEKFKVFLIVPLILSGFLLGAVESVTGVGPFEYIDQQPIVSACIL
jgi:hypothetical protein